MLDKHARLIMDHFIVFDYKLLIINLRRFLIIGENISHYPKKNLLKIHSHVV